MNYPRLKSIVIENFRSLRGKIAVPLDAQVVLIHGTNGMGKTSILSAIELGLTGRIAHLSAQGELYKTYLNSLGCSGGSISITTAAPMGEAQRAIGSLDFDNSNFSSNPLLGVDDARFFSERCYLPQATLGRLLEIYDEKTTESNSPLTLFVKELLGLEPLDALVDGLGAVFHVARVRRIAPDYRHLESLKSSLSGQRDGAKSAMHDAEKYVEKRLERLNSMLAEIATLTDSGEVDSVSATTDLNSLAERLKAQHEQDNAVLELARKRSDLRFLAGRWRELSSEDVSKDQAAMERADKVAREALNAWRTGDGAILESVVGEVRELLGGVPLVEDDPEASWSESLRRVVGELERCDMLLQRHEEVVEKTKHLDEVRLSASARIKEIDREISGVVSDVRSLASALAGIVPHISGEICPVCSRDYSDSGSGSLSAHVAGKIATLTNEAGRLQALSTEGARETRRLEDAQREISNLRSGELSSDDIAQCTARRAQAALLSGRLRELQPVAARGAALMSSAHAARSGLAAARRRDEDSVSLFSDVQHAVQRLAGLDVSNYTDVESAIKDAILIVDMALDVAERLSTLRMSSVQEVEQILQDMKVVGSHRASCERHALELEQIEQALKAVEKTRAQSRLVSAAAESVRSKVISDVFSTALNRTWRDLFVRLAPSEQFVPAFRLPQKGEGRIEAILETLHRSGIASGSPGAMLSQGNLNTAALTLFLALHLSVPTRMPWLVIDDPVQSMDDVHIAQFAALLRTLAKGLQRQVVVAVHERALFDYLALELSPAFAGDSLITVEVSRNFEGNAVATPTAFSFAEDRAIAA